MGEGDEMSGQEQAFLTWLQHVLKVSGRMQFDVTVISIHYGALPKTMSLDSTPGKI